MTPQQKARAASIITGLRERERQLETRLAGWEFEALVLLQELTAEPVRVPLTDEQIINTMREIGVRYADDGCRPLLNHAEWQRNRDISIARAVERKHGIGT